MSIYKLSLTGHLTTSSIHVSNSIKDFVILIRKMSSVLKIVLNSLNFYFFQFSSLSFSFYSFLLLKFQDIVLKKVKWRGKKRQKKAIKLFKTDDVLLMSSSYFSTSNCWQAACITQPNSMQQSLAVAAIANARPFESYKGFSLLLQALKVEQLQPSMQQCTALLLATLLSYACWWFCAWNTYAL